MYDYVRQEETENQIIRKDVFKTAVPILKQAGRYM